VDWPRGVVGVETAHTKGIYRPELAGPVTWREAKVEALRRRGWDRWSLGSGDAWGDAQLLGQAERPLVVVHARSHPTWLEHAQTQGWEQIRPGRRLIGG
jgi:phosphoserine phosphatase